MTRIIPKQTSFNKYIINFKNNKEAFYEPIYNLSLIKQKTLKTYIKTNSVNNFIQSFKYFVSASIPIICKPNKNLCFYINY